MACAHICLVNRLIVAFLPIRPGKFQLFRISQMGSWDHIPPFYFAKVWFKCSIHQNDMGGWGWGKLLILSPDEMATLFPKWSAQIHM